jgi:hypothetical protein
MIGAISALAAAENHPQRVASSEAERASESSVIGYDVFKDVLICIYSRRTSFEHATDDQRGS